MKRYLTLLTLVTALSIGNAQAQTARNVTRRIRMHNITNKRLLATDWDNVGRSERIDVSGKQLIIMQAGRVYPLQLKHHVRNLYSVTVGLKNNKPFIQHEEVKKGKIRHNYRTNKTYSIRLYNKTGRNMRALEWENVGRHESVDIAHNKVMIMYDGSIYKHNVKGNHVKVLLKNKKLIIKSGEGK